MRIRPLLAVVSWPAFTCASRADHTMRSCPEHDKGCLQAEQRHRETSARSRRPQSLPGTSVLAPVGEFRVEVNGAENSVTHGSFCVRSVEVVEGNRCTGQAMSGCRVRENRKSCHRLDCSSHQRAMELERTPLCITSIGGDPLPAFLPTPAFPLSHPAAALHKIAFFVWINTKTARRFFLYG